jgi:HEAT repeat protein
MEGIVAFAVALAVCLATLAQMRAAGARERNRREARYRLARACGLTRIQHLHDWTVSGLHGGLRVRVETVREARQGVVRVVIEGIVSDVRIVPAGRGSMADLVFGNPDVAVGDASFDGEMVRRGPPATVRGLFHTYARERARAVFAMDAQVRIGGGVLTAEFNESGGEPAPDEWQLRGLLGLAHSLEPGATDVTRLTEIALRDPQPGVRAMALDTLAKEAAGLPKTRDVLREALHDASEAVRLQAATALGDEGRPILHALAADATVDDAVSAGATTALGGHMTFARATPLLDRAVVDGRVLTACALLGVMGRGSVAEAQVIAGVLARVQGPGALVPAPAGDAIAVAALEALVATRAPAAEAPFLAALESPRPELVLAAAHGLERVGTVRAIPPLSGLEARGGELRRAARTAIAAIQSRLTGATPGQLTLAGGETGTLAVVESPDGRVSLDPDEPA